jgi:hypothetical protein
MTLATYRLAPSRCAWCGHDVDAATNATGRGKPKAGNITLCIKCGEWNVFTKPLLSLRKPTDKEFEEIAADFDCRKMRWVWVQMMQQENTT